MSDEVNKFLSNECMKAIRDLAHNNPNDMELGAAVRQFVRSTNDNHENQLWIPFIEEND